MLNRILVTILFMSQILTACGNAISDPNLPGFDGATTYQPPPRPPKPSAKPYPDECTNPATYLLRWTQDREAQKYVVNIGTTHGEYYNFSEYSGMTSTISKPLERNRSYAIRIEKRMMNFKHVNREFSIFIPSCANRASWSATHPEYYEPLIFNIDWGSSF